MTARPLTQVGQCVTLALRNTMELRVRPNREAAIRAYVEASIKDTGLVPSVRSVLQAIGGKSAIACRIVGEYRAATSADMQRPRDGWNSDQS